MPYPARLQILALSIFVRQKDSRHSKIQTEATMSTVVETFIFRSIIESYK